MMIQEPACDHTLAGHPEQPMSACDICKDSDELARWVEYWRDQPTPEPQLPTDGHR